MPIDKACDKIYITADELLHDSFRLAKKVLESGYKPTGIVCVWRGGAPVGICMHEHFDFTGHKVDVTIIRTEAYSGIDQQREIKIHPYINDFKKTDKILIVDDVFDTGRTIKRLYDEISPKVSEVRIATAYYKPGRNATSLKPDYYIRETDQWIVFPHEIAGLTKDEIKKKSPHLHGILSDSKGKK